MMTLRLFYIDGLDLGLVEVSEPAQTPDGVHDVGRLDVAGDHLRQHGLELKEVVPAHQGQLNLPTPRRFL